MSRNVEIKAKLIDIQKTIEILTNICSDKKGKIIKQFDVFYNVQQGRMKLRKFENDSGELIYYDRPNQEGPKLCNYEKADISADSLCSLDSVLRKALGVRGVVDKNRVLYMVGQTRVHIDSVKGLGDFVELEVCLTPDQTVAEGTTIAEDLMNKLNISKDNLINCAYVDLLNVKQ